MYPHTIPNPDHNRVKYTLELEEKESTPQTLKSAEWQISQQDIRIKNIKKEVPGNSNKEME